MNSLRILIHRKAVERIAKFAVKIGKIVEAYEIPNYVQMVAPDFVRVTSAVAPASRRAPWILPPIMENGELVYRSYFPSKGELATLYKDNQSYSLESDLPLTRVPWLMLPPAFEGKGMVYKFYSLGSEGRSLNLKNRGGEQEVEFMRDGGTKLVGSSHGWLASFNEHSSDLFLSNPLSGRRIKLPPPPGDREDKNSPLKVIISCSPEEEECRALMSFGYRRLAFCCPGKSKEWTPIGALYKDYHGMKLVRGYDDLVYSASKKLFFTVLEDESTVEGWDLGDPNSPSLIWKETLQSDNVDEKRDDGELTAKDWCRPIRYLVFAENSDQLYLVTRHIMDSPDGWPIEDTKTIDFDVHRIHDDNDSGGRKLCCMTGGSLDGIAMFVGINHSFALSASELTGLLKPNSIYFTHGKGGHDIGVFDYKNKTCTFHLQYSNWIQPPPLWFTPQLV